MASSSKTGTPVHLVVLCHGLWGEPKHLHTLETLLCRSLGFRASITKGTGGKSRKDQIGPNDVESMNGSTSTLTDSDSDREDDSKLDGYLREYVNKRKEEEQDIDVLILNSMSSAGSKTYDGIDWIAERAVQEIRAEEREMKKQSKYIARFSIIGYSLGGLVARYVIALLDSQSFFTLNSVGNGGSVEARHFATFATPHVGVPPANGMFGKLANFIGGRLLSRTGEQLYIRDSGWESDNELHQHKQSSNLKVGLIESMARPGSIFILALNRFQKITIYANAVNDMTVPFRTGCIEEWDPFIERKGDLNVSLMSGIPLLSSVEPGEAPVLTRWEKVRSMTPTLPFFLNPRRLPMNAPYNYLVVLGLPILLPTMMVLVLYRFSTESRKSRARVSELDRGWALEEGKGQDERSRIDKLVRSIVMSSTEDRVDEERNMMPRTPAEETKPANVQVDGKDSNGILDVPANRRSPLQVDVASKKHKQPDLLDPQKKMIRTLNDPAIVPRLEKRWTYFDDVTNSHAIIVCRMPSIDVHRRGLAILKHFVDDFHV